MRFKVLFFKGLSLLPVVSWGLTVVLLLGAAGNAAGPNAGGLIARTPQLV